eukprot:scaffold141984_cov62-Attheya_sp.AAC.4
MADPVPPLKMWSMMHSSVSSNHPMTRSTAHSQPNESGPSTKQAHSKEMEVVPRKVLLPSDASDKNVSDINDISNSSTRKSMDVVTVDNLGGTGVYKCVNQAG